MKLREFFAKYKLDRTKCASDCGIPYPTFMSYFYEKHKPKQAVAELLEAWTDKLVTVFEMRGKDDRIKRREALHDSGSSVPASCDEASTIHSHQTKLPESIAYQTAMGNQA
jgi:hypothetical protein